MLVRISVLLNIILMSGFGFIAYKFVTGDTVVGSDNRTAIILTTGERDNVLAEMRAMLEGVQAVAEALANDEIASIPELVRPLGMAATEGESPALMAKIPLGMKTLGQATHQDMDDLAALAMGGAGQDEILAATADILNNCTTCHAAYSLVAED